MKKATLIIWAIILGFLALVIFQNQDFFMNNHSFRLNLGVMEAYHSPELPIAVLFLIFFFFGIIIAYLFNFSVRFKARRTVKKLNAAVASHQDEMTGLKREIDTLKGVETPTDAPMTEAKIDTEATQKMVGSNLAKSPAGQNGEFSIDKKAANPTKEPKDKSNEKK